MKTDYGSGLYEGTLHAVTLALQISLLDENGDSRILVNTCDRRYKELGPALSPELNM